MGWTLDAPDPARGRLRMNENPENASGKSVRSDFSFTIDENPDRAPGTRPPVQTFRSLSTEILKTRRIGRRFRTFRSWWRRLEGRRAPGSTLDDSFLNACALVCRIGSWFHNRRFSRATVVEFVSQMEPFGAHVSRDPTGVEFWFGCRASAPAGSRSPWMEVKGRVGWIPVLRGTPSTRSRRGPCSESATRSRSFPPSPTRRNRHPVTNVA
jgi:hypothetical protein